MSVIRPSILQMHPHSPAFLKAAASVTDIRPLESSYRSGTLDPSSKLDGIVKPGGRAASQALFRTPESFFDRVSSDARQTREDPFLSRFIGERQKSDDALHGLTLDDDSDFRSIGHCIADELITKAERDRGSLSPEESEFLRGYAWKNMDTSAHISRSAFKALHDFDGLRALVRIFDNELDYDAFNALLELERYDDTLKILGRHLNDMEFIFSGNHPFVTEVERAASKHVKEYAKQLGYCTPTHFWLVPIARDLIRLSESYDVFVPIAKGGLYSGGVADLLGLRTIAMDVKAHERKNPLSCFVSPFEPEDIRGKRVLILDKDVVSGASIREAARLLAQYEPAEIGVYLNWEVGDISSAEAAGEIEATGMAVHHRGNMPDTPGLPSFYLLHERLRTDLGRLRKALRSLREASREGRANGTDTGALDEFLDLQDRLYFSLNHLLPGADEIRRILVNRLEDVLKLYEDRQEFEAITGGESAIDYLVKLSSTARTLPLSAVESLARGRYMKPGLKMADARSVTNGHLPRSFKAAFRTAQRAVEDGYDVGLVVGPEGFAYEPILRDLGLDTVALNIPEADFDGARTLTSFDDLAQLEGKRVLVIEDDVRSGATLRKVIEALAPHMPARLGLYLGNDEEHQIIESIPKVFSVHYLTKNAGEDDALAFIAHLRENEVIFKREISPDPFE